MVFIREAVFEDHDAIAKLHADSWRLNYRGIFSDAWLDNEVERDRYNTWYKRFKEPAVNQYAVVALVDEKLAGFACLFLDDDKVFGSLLDNLHVSAVFQKSGVGKRLMIECAKAITGKANNRKMYLWAYELNRNARLMYEHVGGICYETIETLTEDRMKAKACRYTWADISTIL